MSQKGMLLPRSQIIIDSIALEANTPSAISGMEGGAQIMVLAGGFLRVWEK